MAKDNKCYMRYNRDDSGQLAQKTNPKAPLMKGSGLVNGQKYWLAAWINEDQETKEKYFAINFELPQAQQQQQPVQDSPEEDGLPW